MLRNALLAAAAIAIAASPAAAKLADGAKAPDFSAPAYLAGNPFTYKPEEGARGPVLLPVGLHLRL